MSGAAKCKHCEKTEAEHTDNPADYSNCGDFDPSPAPPAERVIEVAPQGVIQHWATSSIGGRGRGRYNCACGFGRASGISYEAFQRHYIIELESALTTVREERDRARDALRDMLVIAEFDRWHCASTAGRQIAFRKAEEALKPV